MCDAIRPGKKRCYTTLTGNHSHIDFWDPISLLIKNFDGFYPKQVAINFYRPFIAGGWHHQAIKSTGWVGVIKSSIKWVILTFWHWNLHNWYKTTSSSKLPNLKLVQNHFMFKTTKSKALLTWFSCILQTRFPKITKKYDFSFLS